MSKNEKTDQRPPERVALEREMEARRVELDDTWQEIAARGRVKADTLRAVRTGSAPIQLTTRAAIDRGMKWHEGSVDSILAGGRSTPLEAVGPQVSASAGGGGGSQVWVTLPGGGSPVMVPLVWELIPGLEDTTDEQRAAITEDMVARMVHAGWEHLYAMGRERLNSHEAKES